MIWLISILVIMLVAVLYRLIRGPMIEDRLLALNVIAVLIILIMSCYSLEYGQSFYLDIALIYALLSFAEILAFVKVTYISSTAYKRELSEQENKDEHITES